MSFQTGVSIQPAPAVEGAFASANPRASMLAGAGALVAGALGVVIGKFAWALSTGIANSFGGGGRIGFVHRDQRALITAFLAESGMTIPQGLGVTLFVAGEFWARFAAGATIGQKVYAYFIDGSCFAAATASAPTGTAATSTISGSATLTVTGAPTATIALGQPISGTGIAAGAFISAFGTGTGGTGTYTMSANATATGTPTVTFTTAVETNFYVDSTAAAGELAKISTWG